MVSLKIALALNVSICSINFAEVFKSIAIIETQRFVKRRENEWSECENLNALPLAQMASRINNYLVIVYTNRGPRICKAKLNFCCYILLRGRHSVTPSSTVAWFFVIVPLPLHYYNFDNSVMRSTVKLNVCLKSPLSRTILHGILSSSIILSATNYYQWKIFFLALVTLIKKLVYFSCFLNFSMYNRSYRRQIKHWELILENNVQWNRSFWNY